MDVCFQKQKNKTEDWDEKTENDAKEWSTKSVGKMESDKLRRKKQLPSVLDWSIRMYYRKFRANAA